MAYSKHKDMSIFVLDPQGEFAKDCKGQGYNGTFKLPLKDLLQKNGKEVLVYSIKDLVLDTYDILMEILMQSSFFDKLTITHPSKKEIAINEIIEKCKSKFILNKLNLF